MSATIYNFEQAQTSSHPFPEFIFIDTSFLLSSLGPVPEAVKDFPSHTNVQCSNFLDFLKSKAKNGDICLLTSDGVIEEFLHVILKRCVNSKDLSNPVFKAHKEQYMRVERNPVTELLKDHPELIKKHYPILDEYYKRILEVPIAALGADYLGGLNTNAGISDHMCDLINKYQILSGDAHHISIGLLAGIKHFIAIDCDFHRVDDITVYTCLSPKPHKCKVC